jgi:hypothetical protein
LLALQVHSPTALALGQSFVKQLDGTWVAKWDEFDREVEGWMSKGATTFSIGGILRWGTKLPPENEREDVAVKLKLLGEHLKRKGWSERFYFYVFDEPSTAEFADIEALCRFVHQHAPNLNILLTAGYGATGAFRSHAPTPEGAAYRALPGFINIWVPHIDCFDEPFLRERRKLGDQVWMYVCISTSAKLTLTSGGLTGREFSIGQLVGGCGDTVAKASFTGASTIGRTTKASPLICLRTQ